MTDYTADDANRDRRAIDASLRPLNDAFFARTGLTREQFLATQPMPDHAHPPAAALLASPPTVRIPPP